MVRAHAVIENSRGANAVKRVARHRPSPFLPRMNIKLSSDAVRCRVSRAELDRLLSGRAVALEVPLPRNHVFRANVWPGAIGGWQLESDPTGIWITIPKTELQAFAESLPSKKGLEREFEAMDAKVKVIFEVDVRESRPAGD
jgi:hypothetical protein